MGKADVPRHRTIQPTRLCGTSRFTFSLIYVFVCISYMTVVAHRSRSRRSSTRSRRIRSTLPASSSGPYRSSQSSLGTSYLRINGCAKNRSSAPCAPLMVTPTSWTHRPTFREAQSENNPSRYKLPMPCHHSFSRFVPFRFFEEKFTFKLDPRERVYVFSAMLC